MKVGVKGDFGKNIEEICGLFVEKDVVDVVGVAFESFQGGWYVFVFRRSGLDEGSENDKDVDNIDNRREDHCVVVESRDVAFPQFYKFEMDRTGREAAGNPPLVMMGVRNCFRLLLEVLGCLALVFQLTGSMDVQPEGQR